METTSNDQAQVPLKNPQRIKFPNVILAIFLMVQDRWIETADNTV